MDSGWIENPTERQQQWYELFCDFDFEEYEKVNSSGGLEFLRRKVGFAIFGPPDEEPNDGNGRTGYSERMYQTIKDVASFIMEVNTEREGSNKHELHMAIVFVFVEYEMKLRQYPVFRVILSKNSWKFVDINCRVYSTWKNFLDENEMPPGKFCWPVGGVYKADKKGNVQLGWGITPAATPAKQVLDKVDTASSVTALGTSAVFLTALVAPVAAPVMATAGAVAAVTGLYSAVRNIGTLADRSCHGQTINPLCDRQAAASWLSVVGSAAAIGGGAAASRAADLAKNGKVMGRVGRLTCDALNATSLAVNFTGICFGAYCMSERYKEGELTPLDIFQFTSSVLFFAHATVNFKTASNIIKNTQKEVIEDFEKSLRSNRHRKQFKKLAKATSSGSENTMEGNAKVIRGILNIQNKDDFFAGMVRTRKDLKGHKAVFSENGNIIINDGAEVHPMKLYEMGKQKRQEFLSLARQAAQGSVTDASFMAGLESAVNSSASNTSKNSASTDRVRIEAQDILTTQLKTQMVNWDIGRNEVMMIVLAVDELTCKVCPHVDKKYTKWWELIWKHVSKLVKEMLDTYDEAKQLMKELGEFVNDCHFNLQQGIHLTNIFVYFVIRVYERYKDHIQELIDDIKKAYWDGDTQNQC